MSKARQNVDKLNGWINVRDYGAKGDNATDDTAAIQAALTAAAVAGLSVVIEGGTYVVTGLLTANTTMLFDGALIKATNSLKLNGSASLLGQNGGGITFFNSSSYIGRVPNFYDTQIMCGLDETWVGKIQGMTLKVSNIDYCYLISFWNCEGAEVSNNSLLDFKVNIGGSLIGAPNSSTMITGANTRRQKNCRIVENTIEFASGFSGAQLFGAYASEGMLFSNNTCYGNGDDILNADRSTGITFSNNYISTRVGNILINNTDNFAIVGNTIIKEDVGSGYDPIRVTFGGIQLIPTDPTQTFVAKNGVVSNNLIVNNSTENMFQPMLIAGAENVIVSGNMLVNKKNNSEFQFQVTNTSSTLPSLSPVIHNKNLIIKDNVVVNGRILISSSGGTGDGIIAVGNVCNGGGYPTIAMNLQGFSTTRNDYADANIGIGAISADNNMNFDGSAYAPAELLGVFTQDTITSGEISLEMVGGVTYLYTGTNIRLSQVSIQMGAPATTSAAIVLSVFDGSVITNIGTFTIAPNDTGKTFTNLDSGVWLSTIVIPNTKGLRFTISSGGMPGETVTVRLYGSKFKFN